MGSDAIEDQAFVFAMNSQLFSINFCKANKAADFT